MTANTLTTKLVYVVDAIGSLGLGVLLIAFAAPLAAGAGPTLPEMALLVVGIGLLPWAAFNLWIATRPTYPRPAVTLNVVGDLAWIVASLALVLAGGAGLTFLGTLGIMLVGLFVTAVCATKMLGLRQGALAA
jgi:hypothetical protein